MDSAQIRSRLREFVEQMRSEHPDASASLVTSFGYFSGPGVEWTVLVDRNGTARDPKHFVGETAEQALDNADAWVAQQINKSDLLGATLGLDLLKRVA